MKLFKCDHCGQPVYFENYFCVHCNASLGFDSQLMSMVSLKEEPDKSYTLFTGEGTSAGSEIHYKYCINKQYHVCNWVMANDDKAQYCFACNLNHIIPDIGNADYWEKWGRIEMAKHRLVYSLLRFKLPVISKFQDEENGIAFDFKADENKGGGKRLLTGHDNGLITLDIAEADDAIREMARKNMDEVYRTLLGHFRHEIGHYYWDQLIRDTKNLQPFRNLFGDETCEYAEALKQYYNKAPSDAWKDNFISAYASSHPWEDWAETWAHYLHIVDTMETAYSFGMSLNPKSADKTNEMSAKLNIDPYTTKDFEDIIERWIPLSFVMNSLNRSMGLKDSYPFVINETVKEKLNFIHETIRSKSMQ
ncbi:MAG: putative zinc-binding metallopeptidase [Bacteroidota bacterium]|nr:putative zinc-binding metallopeptidase [Bacteroidota bacterium]